jgi:polyphosphate kinase
MTLYRTAAKSKIINYLIEAAQNGKQVAVAVELKVRFDESSNIRWANHLEKAGIHVSFGVLGLKTHCKIILFCGVITTVCVGMLILAQATTMKILLVCTVIWASSCDPIIGEDLTEFLTA